MHRETYSDNFFIFSSRSSVVHSYFFGHLVQNSYIPNIDLYTSVTSSDLAEYDSSFDDAIESLVLPSACTEKLSPSQVENMKTNVVLANEALATAGNAIRATASALNDIKLDVKNKNWTALTESGALHMSGRMARDLVKAYASWIRDTDVPDSALSRVSARVLARIGSVDAGKRTHAINKIKKGEGYTEQDLSKIIGNTKSPIRCQIDDLVAQAEKEAKATDDSEKLVKYADLKIQNIRLQDKLKKQMGANESNEQVRSENKTLSYMLSKAK